jgi:RsiW-degrading membrane proteinase PrsW (M82 family)
MTGAAVLLLAVVPVLAVAFGLWQGVPAGRHRVALGALVTGALVALPLWTLAMAMRPWLDGAGAPLAVALARAFLGASLPEEAGKLFVIAWLVRRSQCRAASPEDAEQWPLRLGLLVGLGFAGAENLIYTLVALPSGDGGVAVVLVRAVTALPCHLCLGAVMAVYAAERRWLRAAVVPLLLHGLYDLPLLAPGQGPAGRIDGAALALSGLVLALLLAWTYELAARARQQALALSRFSPE